jgi:hypothetical protein
LAQEGAEKSTSAEVPSVIHRAEHLVSGNPFHLKLRVKELFGSGINALTVNPTDFSKLSSDSLLDSSSSTEIKEVLFIGTRNNIFDFSVNFHRPV